MKAAKLISVLLLIGMTAAGYYYWSAHSGESAVLYRVETAVKGDIAESVAATGTLNPLNLVDVGTQVSGQVHKLYAKPNDHVEKDQILAEIDPSLLLAQIKQDRTNAETAKAAFEQSNRDLARAKVLFEKDYIARVDLERAQQTYLTAKNGYDLAKAILERDEVNLGYATIRSPIKGIVISSIVTEGQTLQASFQTPNLFKIAGNLKEMKIDVGLAESDIAKVRVGQNVVFTVNAFSDKSFKGVVGNVAMSPMVGNNISSNVVLYAVTVNVDNSEQLLLPGMTAYVRILLSEQKDVLKIPLAALRFKMPETENGTLDKLLGNTGPAADITAAADPMKHSIYVMRDTRPVMLSVSLGSSDDEYVAVYGDQLVEGDLVITGIQKNTNKD